MSIALLALAAQFSLPVALGVPIPDVRAVFSADDMPSYIEEAGVTRFVFSRTTVSSDGKPQDCAAERSSGDPKLDALTCAIILRRAKFQAAKWVDGSPAYAVLHVPVTWAINFQPSKAEEELAYPPDVSLTVNHLPEGLGQLERVTLMIAVDETGRIVDCAQALPYPSRGREKALPQLVPIACQQLTRQLKVLPAKDASGKAVRSIQTASVSFRTGK